MNQIPNDIANLIGFVPQPPAQPSTSVTVSPSQLAQTGSAQVVNAGGGNALPGTAASGGQVQPASVNQALTEINSYLQQQQRTLQFSVDNSTHQTVIKVVDQATGQILRQIPPETMVVLAQRLQEFQHMSTTGIAVKT